MRAPRHWIEPAIFAIALVVWSLSPAPVLAAFVVAYLALWIVFQRVDTERELGGVQRIAALVGAGAIAAVGAYLAVERKDEIGEWEQLDGMSSLLADRQRLLENPSIAPPIVTLDRPQRFWIHAPNAREVLLDLSGAPLRAVDLSHGLFAVDYDPRRDGTTSPRSGAIAASITADGQKFARELTAVRPLAHPRLFCASQRAKLAAVPSEETDEVLIVGALRELVSANVDDGPTACAVLDDGTVLAVHRYSDAVVALDGATGKTLWRSSVRAFAGDVALSPDQKMLAIASNGDPPGIYYFSLAERRASAFIPLRFVPDLVVFGADRDTLVIGSRRTRSLHLFAQSNGVWSELEKPLFFGRPPVTLARAVSGSRVLVSVTDHRPLGDAGPNHHVEDQILIVDVTAWRIADRIATARRDEDGVVVGGASPMQLVEVDGAIVAAFAGTNEVVRIDRAGEVSPAFDLGGVPPEALSAPHGVAELGDGWWAFTSPSSGTIAVVQVAGEELSVHHTTPSDEELGARDPLALARRRGERAFYEATRSGASCQTCHLHGDSDYSLHDIGNGAARPTLSARGIARTAPYLRGASYPRIGDLEHFALALLGGYRTEHASRAQDLAHYVESLPLADHPRRMRADFVRLRTGVAAFVRAECASCHRFPAFTDLAQYPARFLFPRTGEALRLLDTPSLLALDASPPYLDDGRARSITAVLEEHDPDRRHGRISVLDAEGRIALFDLLESL